MAQRAVKKNAITSDGIRSGFLSHLTHTIGRPLEFSSMVERYHALSHTVRDQLMEQWIQAVESYKNKNVRVVGYLSAEYLPGPHLMNDLQALDATESCREALVSLQVDLDDLAREEPEPGLGNGGLGRLAACFMDSLATLGVPAIGYGLRYEFGIFRQEIRDGWQVERTDKWLQFGNPWELPIMDASFEVGFGGRTETYTDDSGLVRWRWIPGRKVRGVPHDTPVPGYRNGFVNRLRLWSAEAVDSFDLSDFNAGDYMGAVRQKVESETISKILYPSDDNDAGKRLRLAQQYFFTSCSLQDMVRLHKLQGKPITEFHQKWSIQLNDTHPSIGIPELMRILLDEELLGWEEAWEITQATFGYTNHTLLPEALERWSLPLFAALLPRHLEIIYEINERFLDRMRNRFPGDADRIRRMSMIGEEGERTVRMANLAVVGSKAVNGVAELHSDLLKQSTLRDFYEALPDRFSNKTNGVTQRRWMMLANPPLSSLINEAIGTKWHTDLWELRELERFVSDSAFLERWRRTQEATKAKLSQYIEETQGIKTDPQSIFDIQVKRIHEYKRQHLNALHILSLYCQLKGNPNVTFTPRTFIFGGKAAPSYVMAKLIIKLICTVGDLVNNDPDVKGRLKVVFLPDYNVSLGQRIYPAADVSEQISTAGKEASGTGCMKFQMNGAVTIGTLDGANVEIRKEVGQDNFFLFGLTTQDIDQITQKGYRPQEFYERSSKLREVIDGLSEGRFSRGDREVFRPMLDQLLNVDPYFLLADFDSYTSTQAQVGAAYADAKRWNRMSILNSARSGKFSSDRTIREYCSDIWKVPVPSSSGAPKNTTPNPQTKRRSK
ncbi:glycogen/starch/alpha-glucan phosphorylase [Granulicella cerasi]|uniref:Alpha-1,4 glucan phosphorylase n=1 Tax=Granulicella cerasi TaxID=741063 RepID=A0ABW1ZDY8_9BACT|nr:glycogen/starch/alpha-glucan phosphorylase [Granulicella cerasi]